MRTKTTSKILSETSEETKEKVRNNANNLINKNILIFKLKTKMEKQTKKPQLPQKAVMHSNLSLADEIELEIAKIFFLANQINRKTEMCCFAYDTAHCGYIEIKLHTTKQDYNGVSVVFQLKYDNSGKHDWYVDTQERLDNAKKCVEFLEQTLKERMINYSILNALKEYVITSYEI